MKLGKIPRLTNRTREELKARAAKKTLLDGVMPMMDWASTPKASRNSQGRTFGLIGKSMNYESEKNSSPVKSDLKTDTQVTIGFKFPYDEYYRFHVNVWRACSPTFHKATMAITQTNTQDVYESFEKELIFLFNDVSDVQEAKVWWDQYQVRFHDMTKTLLPKFANGQQITGHALEFEEKRDHDGNKFDRSDETDFFSDWVWMLQNTSGKVYWTQHHWFFEDSADMVLYKLTDILEHIPRHMF